MATKKTKKIYIRAGVETDTIDKLDDISIYGDPYQTFQEALNDVEEGDNEVVLELEVRKMWGERPKETKLILIDSK